MSLHLNSRRYLISRNDEKRGPMILVSYVDEDWDYIPNHQPLTAEGLDYIFGDHRESDIRPFLTGETHHAC